MTPNKMERRKKNVIDRHNIIIIIINGTSFQAKEIQFVIILPGGAEYIKNEIILLQ